MTNTNHFLKLILPLFIFFALAGCHYHSKDALKFSGTLELTEHSLGAKAAGRLTSVSVEEGETVAAGQVIATLDRYEQFKKDYEREQELLKTGGTTQQSVEHAALAVEDQQVVSPVDGVVLVKVHEQGEIVAAGTPVAVIGDRRDLWVKIFVPEGAINRLELGQPVRVSVDGLSQKFGGKVTFISPQAEFTPRNIQTPEERATQTFAVKVRVDDPPAFLRPGVAADVVIEAKG